MDSLMVGAQVLLAAVLALAGATKLLDLPGSRRAMVDFGVPSRAAPAVGLLVPLCELAAAVALVLHDSARWGALAALTLLLAFSGAVTNALLRGRTPDCHCFGQVHSSPAGPWTLARNAVLAVVAAILVWHGPGPAIDSWIADRTAAELAAIGTAIAAFVLAGAAVRLWLENRELRRDLAAAGSAAVDPQANREGLPPGTLAPNFTLQDVGGETRSLQSLRARGQPVVLQFVDPGCGPCETLLPLLARWQGSLADRVTIAIVTSGSADDRPVWAEHGVSDVLLDESGEVFKAFRVRSTPTAIAVDVDGSVASAPAGGLHMPEVLIRLVVRRVAIHQPVAATTPPTPAVVHIEPPSA